MTQDIQPITRERHAARRWRPFSSYGFAAATPVASVVMSELPRAVTAFPLAFMARDDAFALVAVLGVSRERNLFVTPDGRWLGEYVPAAFRGHPFRLVQTRDGRSLVCVDEGSGLVGEGEEGQPFYDAEGNPAPALAKVAEFLGQVARDDAATNRAVAALAEAGVLQPWPAELKGPEGTTRLEGLQRVDEAGLNALGNEAFLALRASGALPVAYGQLLSMARLDRLGALAQAHARQDREMQEILGDSLGLAGENDLSFDWSKI